MASSTPAPQPARSYRQFCPVAAGMDILGDRWVLLIVRELVFGERRFTDLRRALPGLAPNLLSDRLRRMHEQGLISTPDDHAGYELTDRGRAATPVLAAYARFGADYLDFAHPDATEPAAMDAQRTAQAFLMSWIRPGSPRMRVRLSVPDGSQIDIVVDGHRSTLTEPAGEPDLAVRTDAPHLAAVRGRDEPLGAEYDGSPEAIEKFERTFALSA
ncbi:transcriptional regulator [Epidermidibacterium keratini]|uniref:Transcriptional regulator n=1 Tax=Epidermidibacterium keratini TaxID=1891644 RepID=A0A7L4YNT5_9ACTN|nr:helix-turn-helix domain-containing protein [Epidermidibacterium keratini]QHC00738.1 transcriptional regulator [Epidermidibacterium keratini]